MPIYRFPTDKIAEKSSVVECSFNYEAILLKKLTPPVLRFSALQLDLSINYVANTWDLVDVFKGSVNTLCSHLGINHHDKKAKTR